MTDNEIYLATKQIINMIHPTLKVIKGYQNKRAPAGTYAVVSAIDTKEAGYPPLQKHSKSGTIPSSIGDVTNVDFDIQYQLKSTVTINFYRDNSNQFAVGLLSANWVPRVHAYLIENKLGWHSTSQVMNLSNILNDVYEERAQIKIVFMYEQSKVDQTNAIYSAQVAVNDEDDQLIESIEVNAPTESD